MQAGPCHIKTCQYGGRAPPPSPLALSSPGLLASGKMLSLYALAVQASLHYSVQAPVLTLMCTEFCSRVRRTKRTKRRRRKTRSTRRTRNTSMATLHLPQAWKANRYHVMGTAGRFGLTVYSIEPDCDIISPVSSLATCLCCQLHEPASSLRICPLPSLPTLTFAA